MAARPRGRAAGSGWLTPRLRTSSTCAPISAISRIGRSTTCHSSIWPKFIRLKNAPTPAALNASLPLVAIHCESKFCWDRYPVKHTRTEAMKATTPVIQVAARRPRQAAIQNLPHRWMTSSAMNSSTLHRCRLLKKCPTGLVCHQSVPPSAIAAPLASTTPSAASAATPNT